MTDVPYEMTVGGAFVYVCERDRIKDCVYIMQSVITQVFSRGPRRPRYNGVAVYTEANSLRNTDFGVHFFVFLFIKIFLTFIHLY